MIKRLLKYRNHKDVRYLIESGKYRLSLKVFTLFIGFFLSWFLANNTSKAFYGNYQFILSTLGLLAIFSFPGMQDAIMQSVSRGYDSSLVYGTKKAMVLSLCGSFIFVVVSGYYYLFRNGISISLAFLVCALFFPFFYPLESFKVFLVAKKRFKTELVYYVTINLTKATLMILSVIIFKENLIALISVFFISQIVLFVYFFIKCKKKIKKTKKDDDLIRFGWFMTKISSIYVISNNISRVLIGIFLGPVSLASYSIGIALPDKIKRLLKQLFSVLLPKFASGEMKLTKKKVAVTIIGSLALFLFVAIVLPIFIRLLFSNYTESIGYGLLFSVGLIFFPLGMLFNKYFRAKKNRKVIRSVALIINLSRLVTVGPFLYFFKIYGLIFSELLLRFLEVVLYLYFYNKEKV
jgi:O-antigen/teichoic acid export membrane protein